MNLERGIDIDKILKIKRPGLRIIKTVIAVFLSMLISELRPGQGLPINSSIAAIISMQTNLVDTKDIGINRVIGTILGGLIGLAYLILVPNFKKPYILDYLLMSLIVGLIIWIMAHLKRYNALTIMAIVFLSITLDHVNQTTKLPLTFAFNRTLDTLIGVVISIAINGIEINYRRKKFMKKNGIDKWSR